MELKELKEKQDKEFVKMLLDDPDCSDEEAYKRTMNFLDKVRKETAEAVAEKMIGTKYAQGFYNPDDLNFAKGYNDRIKEEKEIKQQIIKEL